MSRPIQLFMAVWLLLCAGCATLPFDPAPATRPGDLPPEEVAARFAATRPVRYEALQSVVFQAFGRKMTGIGYLAVDEEDGSFALAVMTPAGMKLFDLQSRGGEVDAFFAIDLSDRAERVAQAVAADIRHIYFNTVPPAGSEVQRKKHRLIFTERTAEGRIEYDLAGPEQRLTEKRIYEGRRRVSRIRYGDYTLHDGHLHAETIFLQNRAYHYQLILRVKSVYSELLE